MCLAQQERQVERSDPLPLVETGGREDPGPLPLRRRPHRQREQSVGAGGQTSPLAAHTCGERGDAPPLTQPLPLPQGCTEPPLSAQPRPVVASGGSVSLARSSQSAAGTLHLLKEGGADPPDTGHRGPMGGDRPCALWGL